MAGAQLLNSYRPPDTPAGGLLYTERMRIFLICSKRFYDQIPPIAAELESSGHVLTLPNCYDDPTAETRYLAQGADAHAAWKATMLAKSAYVIEANDAVLVLNFDKGDMKNYIGGATFLEMYDAYRLGKKIFLYNPVPEGILHDEICGFAPTVLAGDLSRIA